MSRGTTTAVCGTSLSGHDVDISCELRAEWMVIYMPVLGDDIHLVSYCRAHILGAVGRLLDDPDVTSVTIAEVGQ